ncbi:hypothetical protein V6N12_073605 [Hibiscus sabdariffa]|uniref:RNase H type-1 domain-containing protein n=1 Tax=Hibiscus sabdariffa TaxID=183260 RepID=A0ABR2A5L4_9ROSI
MQEDHGSVPNRSFHMLTTMRRALAKDGHPIPSRFVATRNLVSWSPLEQGCCKLNTDGARHPMDGMASCGGLLRDTAMNWIFGFTKAISVCSVVEAELLWGIYVVLHIGELCDRQWSVSLQHIRRECNRAADQLEKLTNCEMLDTRVYYVPPKVIPLLHADLGG